MTNKQVYYAKYAASVKGKARARRYYQSAKGKLVYKKADTKRKETESYKLYAAAYAKTPKRKLTLAVYARSEIRKMSMHAYRQTPESKYTMYIGSAKKRKLLFALTFEQFMTFWQKPCHYCHDPVETIGLDRVDNSKGYTLDNTVSCCTPCNRSKFKYTTEAFISHCIKVAIANCASRTDIIIMRQPK